MYLSCVFQVEEKTIDYDRFVNPNILGATRLVHSDLRIYRISLFPLDIITRTYEMFKIIYLVEKIIINVLDTHYTQNAATCTCKKLFLNKLIYFVSTYTPWNNK